MVALADRLDVLQVEGQLRIAAVLHLMVRYGGARVIAIACDDDAPATLTGVEVAEEGLLPDTMRAAPPRVLV